MGFLKKKVVLIFLSVFVCLFVGIQILISINENELDELESKFPLEDYLFADSKEKEELEKLKQELEAERKKKEQNFSQIDEELKRIQESLRAQEHSPYKNLYDEAGNPIALDSEGKPLVFTEDGKRVLLDEKGNPYYTDENNNRTYIDKNTPIYNNSGQELKRDKSGNIIFKDENGNNVVIEGGEKIITDKDGNKITGGENNNDENDKKEDKENSEQKNTTTKDEKQYLYDENGNIIGDSVAVENQKFDSQHASPKQKNINSILALRFNTTQKVENKEKNIEYGVNEFSNFDDKDEGSNEHKLLRTITADRMIPAFLVRPISSQLGGNVVAQVETNIYGAMGRAVLIPKGSRVIGFYQNNNKIGEYRLNVIWTRIITPQGINILLTDAKGADVKGYNGLVGEVHSRNFQRYGIPMTLSTLSNGLLLAINSMNESANANNNANTQIASAYMTAQIMSGMRQDISTIVQRIMQEQMRIQPIITIREGSRIFIAPSQDIFIPIPKKGETLARFFKEEKQEEEEQSQGDGYSEDEDI